MTATSASGAVRLDQLITTAAELLRRNQVEQARHELESALILDPDSVRAQALYGLALFRGGAFAEARPVYERLVTIAPDDAAYHLNLGLVRLKLGDAEHAVTALERSRELDPSQGRATSYLGLAYARGGRFAEAYRAFLVAGQVDLAREIADNLAPAERAEIEASLRRPVSRGATPPRAEPARVEPPPVAEIAVEADAIVSEEPQPEDEMELVIEVEPGSGSGPSPAVPHSQVHSESTRFVAGEFDTIDDAEVAPASSSMTAAPVAAAQPATDGADPLTGSTASAAEAASEAAPTEAAASEAAPTEAGPATNAAPATDAAPTDIAPSDVAPSEAAAPEPAAPLAGVSAEWSMPELAAEPASAEAATSSPSPSAVAPVAPAPIARAAAEAAGLADSSAPGPASVDAPSVVKLDLEGAISRAVADAAPTLAGAPTVGGHRGPLPLSEFATARLIRPDDGDQPFELTAGGFLIVRVTDKMYSRTDGVDISGGALTYEPAFRRARGQARSEPFATAGRPMFQITGQGHLVAAPLGGHFTSVSLDDDILYLREDLLFAFEADLRWENGHVPGSRATIPMVQFRGRGAIAFRTARPLLTVKLAADKVLYVDAAALAGWIGRVVPRAVTAADAAGSSELFVECTGEGVVLVEEPPSA